MDEVPEILLCEVANEVEAALVVNLLNEDGIPARSDANQAMNVFGGLAVRAGPQDLRPGVSGQKSAPDPGSLSSFQEAQERARA